MNYKMFAFNNDMKTLQFLIFLIVMPYDTVNFCTTAVKGLSKHKQLQQCHLQQVTDLQEFRFEEGGTPSCA